ncbi:hypothetical protein INR49_028563, partial [Caranx melampygus]
SLGGAVRTVIYRCVGIPDSLFCSHLLWWLWPGVAEPFCVAWPPSRRTISSIQRVARPTAGAVGTDCSTGSPLGLVTRPFGCRVIEPRPVRLSLSSEASLLHCK